MEADLTSHIQKHEHTQHSFRRFLQNHTVFYSNVSIYALLLFAVTLFQWGALKQFGAVGKSVNGKAWTVRYEQKQSWQLFRSCDCYVFGCQDRMSTSQSSLKRMKQHGAFPQVTHTWMWLNYNDRKYPYCCRWTTIVDNKPRLVKIIMSGTVLYMQM